ncbi:S8 family serine peptidase [Streptomyces sp. URMC 123]|uniref:S8 family serine peptidase n=1 Tax=Streptomyces sp. URMC 123 TaxID=3423403 RepID=UPI003F1A1686
MNRRSHRAGFRAVPLAIASVLALLAGQPTSSTAQPAPATAANDPASAAASVSSTTPHAAPRTAPRAASRSTARSAPRDLRWVTLLTGDRVAVDSRGAAVAFVRARGRESIPLRVERVGGRTRVVPLDAQRLIARGRLDPRLFDVTTLARPEYRASHRDGLRLIVRYEEGRPPSRTWRRSAEGVVLRGSFPRINAEAVQTGRGERAARAWEALTAAPRRPTSPYRTTAPGVAGVWLDALRRPSLDRSVPQIGAPAAWRAGYDGRGVTIAVLDTGVDQTHPDLAGGKEVAEKNFSAAPDTKDRYGHGTHVASIAAGTGAKSGGRYKGVAPRARLLDAKVLGDDGYGEDSGILAGMEWAVEHGADVINLSLGGPDAPGPDPLEAAIDRISATTDTLFVVAAGNSGPDTGSLSSPGSARSALTVGAVDKQDQVTGFSGRGPRVGDSAVKPDLTAPGAAIGAAAAPGSLVARGGTKVADGYVAVSGTSMATPHAAGAAALLVQRHPRWSGEAVKAALIASTARGRDSGTARAPDAFGAFEQGAGRLDAARGVRQSLLAEPTALSFGTHRWPHTDDAPVTKRLTYRNLGPRPVALRLALTGVGPDGDPAPRGMFRLDRTRVTVRPGGTAAVLLTADTRPGGALDGAYSAFVTATGGGHTVRTAAGVDREIESYDVSVRSLGRDGAPAPASDSVLVGVDGLGKDRVFTVTGESGTVRARVPKGRYVLSTHVVAADGDALAGIDWLRRPNLTVTAPTAVTMDARTAAPVDLTVPDRAATPALAAAAFEVDREGDAYGFAWQLETFRGFRTAHSGPAVPAGELHEHVHGSWYAGPGTEYGLAYGPKRGTRLGTGFVKHASARELATVRTTLGAPAAGRRGALFATPSTGGWLTESVGHGLALPATRTLRLNAAGTHWQLTFAEDGGAPDGQPEAMYGTEEERLTAGRTYRKTFNVGVFGPRIGPKEGLFRDVDSIYGMLSLLADGGGHSGTSRYEKATTTLYRNGVRIGGNDDPLTGERSFKVPPGKATYRLVASLDRRKVATVSTSVSAEWTFTSRHATGEARLPASVVRFTPALAADSTAPAARPMRIPVTVQGTAARDRHRRLTVYVSYDGGARWAKVPVRKGAITVKNPKAGKGVSLKATLTGRGGDRLTQVIRDAYRGR